MLQSQTTFAPGTARFAATRRRCVDRTTWCRMLLVVGLAGGLAGLSRLNAAAPGPPPPRPTTPSVPREPEVGPVPTPKPVVDKMLELAELKPGDVLYDLGCGDGRIVVAAAKRYGVKAVGIDLDPDCIRASRANARSNHVAHLVTVKQADIFALDLSEATVVTLYLLPHLNVRLMPQLARLKPGSRIVSHDFDMRGAVPVQVQRISAFDESLPRVSSPSDPAAPLPPPPPPTRRAHVLYKWIVPWQAEPSATPAPPP